MTTRTGQPTPIITPEQDLAKYPNIIAHLMCHSLAYFSPKAAAQAVAAYRNGQEFWCEWYIHMMRPERPILQVGRETIEQAISNRRHHQGFMAHYPAARATVQAAIDRITSSRTINT